MLREATVVTPQGHVPNMKKRDRLFLYLLFFIKLNLAGGLLRQIRI